MAPFLHDHFQRRGGVGFERPLRSRQTLIPFPYPIFHIPSFDALLWFLDLIFCLSYFTSTKSNGYTGVLYYFHSLFCHSDSENVCKFDIWLDIRAWISYINAFSTTFLRNLFMTMHMEIPFQLQSNNKKYVHCCPLQFWTLIFTGLPDSYEPWCGAPAAPPSRGARQGEPRQTTLRCHSRPEIHIEKKLPKRVLKCMQCWALLLCKLCQLSRRKCDKSYFPYLADVKANAPHHSILQLFFQPWTKLPLWFYFKNFSLIAFRYSFLLVLALNFLNSI